MIVLRNILVATDFGEAADVACTYGRGLARAFGATLHLVHVVDDIVARATSMASFGMDLTRMQDEVERGARARLGDLLTDDDRTALGARAVVLRSTNAGQAIADYAAEHDIDLIVAGTHGRGAVASFFVGSVAERLGRVAPCPVLLVRHPEREFVLPDALEQVRAADRP